MQCNLHYNTKESPLAEEKLSGLIKVQYRQQKLHRCNFMQVYKSMNYKNLNLIKYN